MVKEETTPEIPLETTNLLVPNKYVKACPTCDKTAINKRKGKWYCWKCKTYFKEPVTRIIKGGGKRANPENIDILTEEEIYTKLSIYTPPNYSHTQRDKAFVSGLIKTGSRINEFLGTTNTPKLTLGSIEWTKPDELTLKLPVLKRRKRINKSPPIILSADRIGQFFADYIKSFGEPDYTNGEKLKQWKETILFDFGRIRGYQIVKKILGKAYFPHFLRHQCITDLVKIWDFSDTQAVSFIGLADARQMSRYAHLRSSDLSAKIRAKIQQKNI